MKASVTVTYSQGHRPAQFTYGAGGLSAEFTLMTKGTSGTAIDSSRAATPARGLSVRPVSRAESNRNTPTALRPSENDSPLVLRAQMNTTNTEAIRERDEQAQRKLPTTTSIDTSAPPASINPDSLFFPAAEDDDNQWDPQNFEDDQGMVTWESENVFNPSALTGRRLKDVDSASTSFRSAADGRTAGTFEIPPTQRLSQVKGLFD